MVWVGQGPLGQEIYVYDATTKATTPLTSTNLNDSPQINANGDIVWVQYNNATSDNNIMLYIKATKKSPGSTLRSTLSA